MTKLSDSWAGHDEIKPANYLPTSNTSIVPNMSYGQTYIHTDRGTKGGAGKQGGGQKCSVSLTCDIMHTGGVGLHPRPLPGGSLWLSGLA